MRQKRLESKFKEMYTNKFQILTDDYQCLLRICRSPINSGDHDPCSIARTITDTKMVKYVNLNDTGNIMLVIV
jgi:hypothetical protein